MACEQSLEWLRAKVKAMRSFGGSLLGYIGLPLETKSNVPGECVCVGSGAKHLIDQNTFV
ncbi:MAG: hypothetical protein QXF61_08260 [Nitrososphaeria archaeon]